MDSRTSFSERSGAPRGRPRSGIWIVAIASALIWTTVFAGVAQAAPGTNKRTFSTTSPVAIPDAAPYVPGGIGVLETGIVVSGLTGDITRVTASFHIVHEQVSDLDIAIADPRGWGEASFAYLLATSAVTGENLGSGCDDPDRTMFDDDAAVSIDAGTTPYAGTYRPQDSNAMPLGVFDGMTPAVANGLWTLGIFDSLPGGTGSLECWSLMIETTTGQALRFDSNDPLQIADAVDDQGGPGVASSPITVSDIGGAVSAITVSVWITHPNVSDLDVELVGPDGETVTLARDTGGTGDDFGRSCNSSKMTIFDDTAKQSITKGVAPFVGTFRPTQPLGLLDGFSGSALNGEWQLRVTDRVEANTGTINCWSMTVSSTTIASAALSVTPFLSAPAPLPGTFDYAYFVVRNPSSEPVSNVVLTATMPNTVTDLREEAVNFPECEVAGKQLTCTYADIGPGASVLGGALARIGAAKSGKVCMTGTVGGDGVSDISTTACFNTSAYPTGDRGTGYAIGDTAHDLVLLDQAGTQVSLSQLAGKYVLLQFTSAWCAPSNFEVPQDRDEVQALNESNAMGVEVVYLTVMLDGATPGKASTQRDAQRWADRFELTTPVLYTSGDTDRLTVQQHTTYSIEGGESQPVVPVSVFIRPNGEIFDLRIGIEESGGTTSRFLSALP